MTKLYCQGDVMIRRVDAVPNGATPIPTDNGRVVLAYGELTGHSHSIDQKLATMFGLGDDRFLTVAEDAPLQHQEHDTIILRRDTYQVIQQRTFERGEIRRVAD